MRHACVVGFVVVLLVAAAAPAPAQVKVGEEMEYAMASPPVYPAGTATRPVTWVEHAHSPGATFLRLHFVDFNLPPGDFLTVASPDGAELWTYTDRGPFGTGEFWSFMIEGDTAVVELHAGPRRLGIRSPKADVMALEDAAWGYRVDRIAHGTAPIEPELLASAMSICGTDGRRDAACYTSVNTRPVARLSYQKGGSSYVCTGWLVRGSYNSTMLTNNHCFTTQSEVNTVQARFNYQRTTCGGTTTATYSTYYGGTFLKTSSTLDYTIFTLQGNPEATWGEYIATSKTPTVGLTINLPQHPGGGLKKVGYWENSNGTGRCTIGAVGGSYGYAAGSQMAYGCDTEGGSSGSPVMDAATGRIIGLHHLGNVSSSGCLNAGTYMKNVCANAGSLLSCATY